MIKFNELRITPNNDKLIIDVSIEDFDCCENAVLDSIVIDTQDTYVSNGPSSKPVFTYSIVTDDDLVYSDCNPVIEEGSMNYCFVAGDRRSARLILEPKDISVPLHNNMFFVYVITSGSDNCCSCKSKIGTVVNLYPIYKNAMNYIKELSVDCSIPKNFVDYILRIKALDLSIKTGNYHQAIIYWNKLFKNYNVKPISSNCGCYGGSN